MTCGPLTVESCGGNLDCGICCPDINAAYAVLAAHPPRPSTLDIRAARQTAFETLDEILLHDRCALTPEVEAFYVRSMERVAEEMRAPVTRGVRVWMAYNHGFIVKTPNVVLAFDVVHGFEGWRRTRLPAALVEQIDVLFVSHDHGDHRDWRLFGSLIAAGKTGVVPSEVYFNYGIGMWPGERVTVAGVDVVAHDGLHSVPLRIYEVTTAEGFRILHTGDNQTSETLPFVTDIDLLLLNAWVNESGQATPMVGMRDSIDFIQPQVVLFGHMQELAHPYEPENLGARVAYGTPLQVLNEMVLDTAHLLLWGERVDLP